MKRMSWAVGIGMLVMCLAVTGCKQKPAANLGADVVSGTAPLTVQFADISTWGSSSATAWHWLFGDGAESALQNPSHVYTFPGTYNVSLEVTTADGSDTELKLAFIQVAPPLVGNTQTVMLPGNVPLEMVWMPGGTFMMGRYPGEQDSDLAEDPQHSVTLGGYWMGSHEVTKRQWTAVMGTTPWSGQPNVLSDPDSPAVYLSWNDAQAFLAAVSSHAGRTFRLPSEAQWECACRAGEITRFYWGDDPGYTAIVGYAWYAGNCQTEQYAHAVGTMTVNNFHLHDMSGNVSEWCEDDWHNSYTGAPADGQAWVDTPRSPFKVLRGGDWSDNGFLCRSASRALNYLDGSNNSIGLRVVQAL